MRYFLLIIPLCTWKNQSCCQWNLEFVEIEYFQDWPKINYGVKNVAFFSPSHAAQMKSSEAFSHNARVLCFPFNKASSGRLWHNWFLGFRDLEMAGTTEERRGEETPAGLWFKYYNTVAKSCCYYMVILHFSCKKMLSMRLCCRTGTFKSHQWHGILNVSLLSLHCIIWVLFSHSSRNDGRIA